MLRLRRLCENFVLARLGVGDSRMRLREDRRNGIDHLEDSPIGAALFGAAEACGLDTGG